MDTIWYSLSWQVSEHYLIFTWLTGQWTLSDIHLADRSADCKVNTIWYSLGWQVSGHYLIFTWLTGQWTLSDIHLADRSVDTIWYSLGWQVSEHYLIFTWLTGQWTLSDIHLADRSVDTIWYSLGWQVSGHYLIFTWLTGQWTLSDIHLVDRSAHCKMDLIIIQFICKTSTSLKKPQKHMCLFPSNANTAILNHFHTHKTSTNTHMLTSLTENLSVNHHSRLQKHFHPTSTISIITTIISIVIVITLSSLPPSQANISNRRQLPPISVLSCAMVWPASFNADNQSSPTSSSSLPSLPLSLTNISTIRKLPLPPLHQCPELCDGLASQSSPTSSSSSSSLPLQVINQHQQHKATAPHQRPELWDGSASLLQHC